MKDLLNVGYKSNGLLPKTLYNIYEYYGMGVLSYHLDTEIKD